MPEHGHNKISPIICLCSLKIIDKSIFFFHFPSDCRVSWLGETFIVSSAPNKVHLRSSQSKRCLVYSTYLWPTRWKNSIWFVQRKTAFTRKCRERTWSQWNRRLLWRYEQKVRQAESAVNKGLTKEANRFAYVDSSHEMNQIKFVYSDSEKCFAINNVRELSGVQFGL